MKKRILYIGNKLSDKKTNPTAHNALKKALEAEGFQIISASHLQNKLLRLGHMISSFFRHFKNYDLVLIDLYSTQNFWYAVVISRLAKSFGKDYIPILHGGDLKRRFSESPKTVAKLFKNAREIISPSQYLKQEVIKLGFTNVLYLPNPLDIKDYKFKPRDSFEPELLWVRAFNKIYNPLLAIKTLELLLKDFPQARLTMVGPDKDGSLRSCRTYSEEKKLPVTFPGKLNKKKWTALAEECDIFLNTTQIDNTPVSVIEAMALGLPVVSTNVGGIPYLLEDKRSGLLVVPNDPVAMANSVKILLDNPRHAESIAVEARRKAKSLDWEIIKQKWIGLLS